MDWHKALMVAAVAIPVALGAVTLYKRVSKEMTPDEGDLVVNVNIATQEELETIPGIGPSLAREIIRERPFSAVEDLERVRGIGGYILNSIRPYVKVDGTTEERK